MGAKFREKRKLPSEINFVPKAFATKIFATKAFAKFRDSGNIHESHEIWPPPEINPFHAERHGIF